MNSYATIALLKKQIKELKEEVARLRDDEQVKAMDCSRLLGYDEIPAWTLASDGMPMMCIEDFSLHGKDFPYEAHGIRYTIGSDMSLCFASREDAVAFWRAEHDDA